MSAHRHLTPLAFALAASLSLALPCLAAAQPAAPQSNTPSAVQGFSKNRDQPVQIDAQTLEVRDKDKVATFSGNVHVIQGDMHLRSQVLKVFYEGETSPAGGAKPAAAKSSAMLAAQPGPDGQSRIKRLEASGGVVVTQNDQVAQGKFGVFDMPSNTVTLTGDVVVSQGKNVSRGEKLVVDLTTGTSKMTGGKGVRILLDPQAGKDLKKDKDGAAPAPASGPRSLSPPAR